MLTLLQKQHARLFLQTGDVVRSFQTVKKVWPETFVANRPCCLSLALIVLNGKVRIYGPECTQWFLIYGPECTQWFLIYVPECTQWFLIYGLECTQWFLIYGLECTQ